MLKWGVGPGTLVNTKHSLDLDSGMLLDLLDLSDEAVLVCDASDGTIRFWNRAAERLYCWSRADAVGQSARSLLRTEFPCPLSEVEAQLRRDGSWEGELVNRCQDGTPVVVLSRWRLHRATDARHPVLLRIDSYHQLQAAALRASELRVRRLIDSNIIGITLGDLHGRILEANDALLRMVGYSREDLRAGRLRWDEMTPPEYLHLDELAVAEAHRAGAARPWEKEYIRKDGSRVPVMIGVALLDERAGTTVGFIVDLSEQKRGETERNRLVAENERQQALLEAVFTATPTCLLAVSGPQSTIRFVNPSYVNLMPHPEGELIGRELREVWPDAADVGVLATVDKTVRTGKADTVDRYEPRYADGSTRCFELRSIELNWLGEPGALIALWDITPLEQARAAAEAAVRTRDEFISVASHELKTPISGLLAVTQLAGSRLARGRSLDDEQVGELVEQVKWQAERLNLLTARLLDASRIRAGTLALEREPTDLVGLVRAIVRATVDDRSIVVAAPAELIADVDPLRLEQVLRNLLENARKYSPPGSPVEVEVSAESPGLARITVRDHGPGISSEHRPHIFEQFYRAHSGSQISGMGLGLHISRQIVELHAGSIDAEFPADGGTRFVVTLPIARPLGDQH
jgi:PAS domain S-box-containing protein